MKQMPEPPNPDSRPPHQMFERVQEALVNQTAEENKITKWSENMVHSVGNLRYALNPQQESSLLTTYWSESAISS